MIEKWIKNENSLKRYKIFKSTKRAYLSVWALLFFLFFSATAELWSNNKPLIMKYKEQIYFPVFKFYHPSIFGQKHTNVTDYRSLQKEEAWSVWPLIIWDPYESNSKVQNYPSPPTFENWMGTDDRGRDIFSRLIYGFRYSIGFALLVWIFSFSLGTVLGALMGFFGGKVDLIGQRLVEVFESMNFLLLLIILVAIFGSSFKILVILTSCLTWMMISIYMRAEFLKLRKREFVEACRASGGSYARQIFKHILPNGMVPIITFSPFVITGMISTLAVLDYLGFGLAPPTPSWGELLQQAQKNITIAWWLALFPSLALFVTLLVFNLIGEGIREAFDPRNNIE